MRDPPPHPDLKISQSVLAFVSTAKVLGVWLQNDLKWDTQENYMNKNVVKGLFMLRFLKCYGFNKPELVTVYKDYIRPLLEYSDVIWYSSLTSNQTHQLERVQKRALRIIPGTDYISYANTLDVCDVDHLSAWREQHSLKFAQSLPQCSRISKLLPQCRGEIHGRQLRNNASPMLAIIDMLVVQSHIMWSWSTANSHNWTSCFLFSPLLACFTVGPCFCCLLLYL